MEQLYKQMLDFGKFRAAENAPHIMQSFQGSVLTKTQKSESSRGRADL